MSKIKNKIRNLAVCGLFSLVVVFSLGCQRGQQGSCGKNCEPCVIEYEVPCVLEFEFQRCPSLVCCPKVEEKPKEHPLKNIDEDYLYDDEIPLPHHYQPSVPEYRASVGDVLEISVFDEEETMMADVAVAPDGKIYYLFLEGIDARGKTIPEIKKAMSSHLTNLFINPTVSIIPRLMMRDSFTILGRVSAPGIYPLMQQVTVRQAIGIAGGLATDQIASAEAEGTGTARQGVGRDGLRAAQPDVVFRQSIGRQDISNLRNSFIVRDGERLPIDFEKLVYSGDITQDIPLHAGDYLYIAPNDHRNIYILGEGMVGQSLPYIKDMTLIGGLATAGGWRDDGAYGSDITRVLVLRGSLECPEFLVADLTAILRGYARDVYLQPGDIIYIHYKPYRFIRELVELSVNTFFSSFGNIAGDFVGDKLFYGD